MAPSPTIRRLLKEAQELSAAAKHPNPTFHAAPLSENNLHEWHFTLLGPPAPSPYAGGIYHGRITLPPAYPMKPPNFRFLTPSGRFEVNREICLSISGFHEETWQPAWGVRLALTALRGFMGEEGTAGQVGGLESSKDVRQRQAKQSRHWKCFGCGGDEEGDNRKGWSNEERMKWWWEICREKGVNVEAEIEGLENLPDGMKVEARDVKQDKGKQKEAADDPEVPSSEEAQSPVEPEKQQISAESAPTSPATTENISRTDHDRITNTTVNNITRPLQQIPVVQVDHIPQFESPITIDRAIYAVFLALIIMILKKMFYPSTASTMFGGYDDLRMVRE